MDIGCSMTLSTIFLCNSENFQGSNLQLLSTSTSRG